MGNQGTTVVIRIVGCDNINVISCCCTNVLTPSVIFKKIARIKAIRAKLIT